MKTKDMRANAFPLMLAILAQGFSVYFGKKAAGQLANFSPISAISNANYLMSLFCLGVQFLAWTNVLKRMALFKAYLAMSLVYPLILGIGILFFGESIKIANIAGIALIMAGVVIIGGHASGKS